MNIAIIGDPLRKNEDISLINKSTEIFEQALYAPVDEIRVKTGGGSKILHNKIDLLSFDCILPIPNSTYSDMFLSIASILEKTDVYVPYSLESLLLFQRRVLGLAKLKEAGFNIVEMNYFLSDKTVEGVLGWIEFPVDITIGNKSYVVEDKRHLIGMVRLRRPGQGIMIKEVLREPVIECMVVGDDVIATVEKGKKLKSLKIGSTLQKIAVNAVKELKSDYGFVSLSGDKIVSLSLSSDFNAIERATAKGVSTSLLRFIQQNIKVVEKKTIWDRIVETLKVGK